MPDENRHGLIGEKLGHSYSKVIHEKLGTYEYGNYEYELYEVPESRLETFLTMPGYGGFNVTIPYKKKIMRFCSSVSDTARRIGAVNTVVRQPDMKWKGYNTDAFGFRYLLKKGRIDPSGKRCLVLGSGGASAMVTVVLSDMGAADVTVVSRKGTKPGTKPRIIGYDELKNYGDVAIIINTTPVGMYPDNLVSPINLDDFPDCRAVVDLIYNPYRTKLIMDAEQKKIPCIGGLVMLVAQATLSAELFCGTECNDRDAVIDRIADEVKKEMLNIIYIGMPGSGKTCVGEAAAKRLGRPFADIDRMIVERTGMDIPEFFRINGEDAFRRVETEVLADVCRKSGQVIATGGGVVERRVNRDIIRQNGFVIWLKRDPAKLDTDGRPVSQTVPIAELYERRRYAYEYWSDITEENKA